MLWTRGSALALERAGVLVTSGAAWGAPDHVRITVPHRDPDVDRLLRAIEIAG